MAKDLCWISLANSNGNFFVIFLLIISIIDHRSHIDGATISFTKPVYDVGIYQDQDIRKYVTHYDFQMGIPKPNEDGEITYRIRDSSDIINTFEPESKLIGDFYYLRIRTKYSAVINRETISSYNLTVAGIFENRATGQIIAETKTQVFIKILDKNDNCPLFTKERFEFTLYENASFASQVGLVSATDADEGINSEIFYFTDIASLQSELKRFPFSINPFSGAIYPSQSLSEFVGEKLIGKVSAIHRGDLSLITCDTISHAQISMVILPDNQHYPKITIKYLKKFFNPLLDDLSFAEITVSDEDDVPQRQRNPYPIVVKGFSKLSLHIFLIPTGTINNYLLKIRALSTTYTKQSITVTIETRDLASRPKTSSIQLTIPLSQFRDINLLSVPRLVSINVPENTILNSTIVLLKSLINSTNENNLLKLHFTWNADANSAFMFGDLAVSSTGVMSVHRELNAEDYGSRERTLSIGVSMEDSLSERKMITVRIFIDDVNEFPPVVNNNGSLVFVKENADLEEPILTIDAYDPDISRTRLTYYLFDKEYLPFKLSDTTNNVLVLKYNLDAETMERKFQIRVLVTDSGLPLPRSVIAYYEVELMDENEYKPEFLYQYCSLIISRDTPYDYKLGHFIAEDLDRDWRDKVKISIASVSIQEPCFSINPQTGALVLLCSLRNRVLAKLHNFTIQLQANDSVFLSPKLTLNVTVVESNSRLLSGQPVQQDCSRNNIYTRMQENFDQMNRRNKKTKNPVNTESLPNGQLGSRKRPTFVTTIPKNIHLREELSRGYIVQTISMETGEETRDPYESQFVFGIWAQGGQLAFSIKPIRNNAAQIVVADRLDRETLSKYLLTVAVCDQGKPRLCTYENIDIQIEDINDNRPRFVDSFPAPLELPENYEIGKRVIQIEVTDDDSFNTIQYRLVNFRSVFRIHKRTGWLKLRDGLDRERLDQYQLIITASDHSVNSKSLTSTLTLSIVIGDINDNKPIFAKNSYTLSLPEDLPVGSFLVQLHATDLDIGVNAQLRYAVHGIHADCFKCDELTGTVHLLCKLSAASEYSLIAVVKDSGKLQSHSSQSDFKIYPQRIQSTKYVSSLREPLVQAYIRENSAAGTLVATLVPENPDRAPRTFVYTIGGQSSGISEFHINNEGN